jgi:hypothetical protein
MIRPESDWVAAGVIAEYEYMRVIWWSRSPSGKTNVFEVQDRHLGTLGRVRWFGRWRQYVFYPERDCLFSAGCLRDLASFLEDLMKMWRTR